MVLYQLLQSAKTCLCFNFQIYGSDLNQIMNVLRILHYTLTLVLAGPKLKDLTYKPTLILHYNLMEH
jgi:hypothetical protein